MACPEIFLAHSPIQARSDAALRSLQLVRDNSLAVEAALLGRRSSELPEIEAIKVHHLVPCGHKVTQKRLLPVAACIDFRERSKLRI